LNQDWKRSIAVDNFKLFRENAGARQPWERDAVRFDDFRYGIQFSRSEEEQLLLFRQSPLAISITTAICDSAESLMVASKPTIKTAPIVNPYDDRLTEISRKVAQKYNYLIQKSWYDSLGGLQYDRVVRDSSNVGHGFFYIVPRDEFGEFSVDIKHINWRYVYPNKMTKDPFYRDMDNCSIAMKVSKEYGYRFVKSFEPELTWEQFEDEFVKGAITMSSGPANQNTKYLSYGSGKDAPMLFNVNIKLEEYKYYLVIPKQLSDNNKPVVKTYFELPENVKKDIADEKATVRERKGMFLTENIAMGNQGFKRKYTIRDLNIVSLTYDHRDNPYPHGRIWYLYPIQRTFNKMIMIALLNGALLNATRVIAEERSIVDGHEWDTNFATPGARLLYRVVGNPNTFKSPQIIEGKPLGEAWLQFPRFLMYAMEYVSGIWSSMQGDSSNSSDVFSTVAALQSAGGQKIKRRLAHADAALSVVGNIVGQFYKEFAPLNGFSTMIDEKGEMQEPMLYNRLIANPDNPKELTIDPETDLSYGFKDVRFTSQGSSGFEAGTEAAMLTNLATQLAVPQLVPLILRRLNIPDVDKIVDSLNLVSSQASTIEQLTQTLQDVEKRARVLAGTVTQKSFELSKSQFDAKFTKLLADYKTQLLTAKGNGNG